MERLRIRFEKNEHMRYIGHLDLFKAWERTFRRAHLPLAYSQGFHPQPRLHLASALPLGFTSQCEVLDVWLEDELPIEEVGTALEETMPPGIKIGAIQLVDLRQPSLQTRVISADYEITLLEPVPHLDQDLRALREADSLPRQRRGKAYDLRPLIEALDRLPDGSDNHPRLYARLTAQEGATGRPEELLGVLGIPVENARVHRTRLNFIQETPLP